MFRFIKKYKKDILRNIKIWSPLIWLFLYFIILFTIGVKNFFMACIILCVLAIATIFFHNIYKEFKNPIVRRIISSFDIIEEALPEFMFYKTIDFDTGHEDVLFEYGFTGILNNAEYTFANYTDTNSDKAGFVIRYEPLTDINPSQEIVNEVSKQIQLSFNDLSDIKVIDEAIIIFFDKKRFEFPIQTIRNKKLSMEYIDMEINEIKKAIDIINTVLQKKSCGIVTKIE